MYMNKSMFKVDQSVKDKSLLERQVAWGSAVQHKLITDTELVI